jgi:nucleoside-diphosphate-sugar epimerase
VAVSALTRSPERAGELAALGIAPVVGDVLAPDTLQQLPEADLCLWAVGSDRRSGADQRSVYVDGLENVLRALPAEVRHLIYVSSTSVYGQNQGEWVNEESPTVPQSPGGVICLAAEQVIPRVFLNSSSSRQATIVRLAGIYGPGRLIGRLEQLSAGVPQSGNPEAWLNLIHVSDIVQGLQHLAERTQNGPLSAREALETFVFSDGTPLTRRDFYSALAAQAGCPAPVFSNPETPDRNKRIDSRRIRETLGLQPGYPDARAALAELL